MALIDADVGYGRHTECACYFRRRHVRNPVLLRGLLVACQGMSVLLTWSLWQVRAGSAGLPNLPVFDSVLIDRWQVPFGEAMLLTLAAAIVWPRVGCVLHGLVLTAAICFDQQRIQ